MAVLTLGGGDDDDGGDERAQTTAAVTPSATAEPSPTATATLAPPAAGTDERAIVRVLEDYERGYTNQDLDLLGGVFAADVTRRGRDGASCVTTEGREDVLGTYESQFAAGAGAYELLDLSGDIVELDGDTASATSRYAIAPGASGSVNFRLRRGEADDWQIDRVIANC